MRIAVDREFRGSDRLGRRRVLVVRRKVWENLRGHFGKIGCTNHEAAQFVGFYPQFVVWFLPLSTLYT